MNLKMTIDELHAFVESRFPQVTEKFRIEHLAHRELQVRMLVKNDDLRPGGTVSGPSIFSLADVSVYFGLLAIIGPVELAVTTNCSIDFLRKPGPRDLIAKTRLLKVGRRLAFGDVLIFSEGMSEPVAHAGLTYSIPG